MNLVSPSSSSRSIVFFTFFLSLTSISITSLIFFNHLHLASGDIGSIDHSSIDTSSSDQPSPIDTSSEDSSFDQSSEDSSSFDDGTVSVQAPRRINFPKDQSSNLGPSPLKLEPHVAESVSQAAQLANRAAQSVSPSTESIEPVSQTAESEGQTAESEGQTAESEGQTAESEGQTAGSGQSEMESHEVHYTSSWIVRLRGPKEIVDQVAYENGYQVKKQLPERMFPNTYVFVKLNHPKRAKRESPEFTQKLGLDPRIDWAQQEVVVERVKRDFIPLMQPGNRQERSGQGRFAQGRFVQGRFVQGRFVQGRFGHGGTGHERRQSQGRLPGSHDSLIREGSRRDSFHSYGSNPASSSVQVLPVSMTRIFYPNPRARGHTPLVARRHSLYNDELWNYQWYMRNTENTLEFPNHGLNIEYVHKVLGFTGKNIRACVLDDGLEHNHTDLVHNYDPEISYDTNDDDDDPFPRYDPHGTNSHGTKCAGEIAMSANNYKCGVGVAPSIKIGAVRCLDGQVVDSTEAASLGYRMDIVDIYSASWGPPDDGSVVDGPKRLAREVMERAITLGRGGKGAIYVWASGNGGSSGDNCNCDGYASSIYTISIASSNQHGQWPWYGERCSSTIAVAYSSGTYSDAKIATTDLHNHCTIDHTGTSAAAPLATGIIALLLEARPDVTWRDVQHLIIETSSFYPLKENSGWFRNAAGYLYSSKLGFGLLNAKELVLTALNWTLVPSKSICSQRTSGPLPVVINAGKELFINFISDGCKRSRLNEVNSLEHVQILISIEYPIRGSLDLYLKSPAGTVSMLLSRRKNDKSKNGFSNWFFTSLHFWGESADGKWTLLIRDRKGKDISGRVTSVYLILHGTKSIPNHLMEKKTYQEQEVVIADILDTVPEYELDDDVYEQNSAPNILMPIVNLATHLNWNDYGHALTLVSRNQMIKEGAEFEGGRSSTKVQWPDD